MPQVVQVMDLDDATEWDEWFRSNQDVFTEVYGAMGMHEISFTTTKDHHAYTVDS